MYFYRFNRTLNSRLPLIHAAVEYQPFFTIMQLNVHFPIDLTIRNLLTLHIR